MRNTRLALAVLTGMVSVAGGVAAIPAVAGSGTTTPSDPGSSSPVADPTTTATDSPTASPTPSTSVTPSADPTASSSASASASGSPSSSSSAPAPTASSSSPTVKVASKAPARTRVTPNFGLGKTDGIPIGVEVKDGAYVPADGTTAGSVLKIVETGGCETNDCEDVRAHTTAALAAHHVHLLTARRADDAPVSETTYCTTQADPSTLGETGDDSETFCDLSDTDTYGDHAGADGYVPYPGDDVTVTQVSVPTDAPVVVDPETITHTDCYSGPAGPGYVTFCFGDDETDDPAPVATFVDAGAPPVVVSDPVSVLTGDAADIDVLANDRTFGAPETITGVTQPGHGTATIEGDGTYDPSPSPSPTPTETISIITSPSNLARVAHAANGTQTILYKPKAGFLGRDRFTYTVTTANGSASGSVLVDVVAPPPTAVAHSARTTTGVPVTVDVVSGDDAHGGGALTVAKVGVPAHGTATISGDSVTYTPAAGFVGTDAFAYTVATAYGSATATVTVTVAAATSGGSLPFTGLDAEGLALGAVSLLGGGAGLRVLGRRRRHSDS